MKYGITASLALACALLASCATTDNNVSATEPNPCLGVAPALGTAIVRKEDCGGGRKQSSIAAPASGGVVYDKKLERSGQTGR